MVRRVEGLAAKPDSLNPQNPHVEGENRFLWKEGRKEGRSVGSEGGRNGGTEGENQLGTAQIQKEIYKVMALPFFPSPEPGKSSF